MPEIARKPGTSRAATLNAALAGDHAADGRDLATLRRAALAAIDAAPEPVWRRSGFWTTSLRELDLTALADRRYESDAAPSRQLASVLGDDEPAGLIVQRGSSVVTTRLDRELTERGVILCSLEEAAREHTELFAAHYMKRTTYDRDRIEATAASHWAGGAFLYVPPGLHVAQPFQIVYEIPEGDTAQYARTLAIVDRGAEIRLREYDLAGPLDGPALHAGAFELFLKDGARCRLAQLQDFTGAEVYDVSKSVVEVGRDAYCHWLPSLLGAHLTRHHTEIAVAEPGGDMAFRGLFFSERDQHLDVFGVDLHETGPSGGDVHWRGAATGSSRASFEGLIQIDPGAQQTHTYLQIHTMMLSPTAKIDAIPSVLVSSDDVSASHGGTVGELDESSIFYMRTRGLTRADAVRVIVEGFFEPLIVQLEDPTLERHIRDRIAAKLAAAADDIAVYAAAR